VQVAAQADIFESRIVAHHRNKYDLDDLIGPSRREHHGGTHQRENNIVSDTQLVQLTESAGVALGAFDFSTHEGKGIRVFVQGFG